MSKKSIGKPMLIAPPTGKCTGTNSANIDIIRKNKNGIHIRENEGKEGNKYKKRAIANIVTTPIYILSFGFKILIPPKQ